VARSKPPPVLNDGWTDTAYDLGTDAEQNARVSKILNEACHVFRHHAEGTWSPPGGANDKDAYASMLAVEIELRPGLVKRLLDTGDRVVRTLTFRAVEIAERKREL
jgi:hypothetical protein